MWIHRMPKHFLNNTKRKVWQTQLSHMYHSLSWLTETMSGRWSRVVIKMKRTTNLMNVPEREMTGDGRFFSCPCCCCLDARRKGKANLIRLTDVMSTLAVCRAHNTLGSEQVFLTFIQLKRYVYKSTSIKGVLIIYLGGKMRLVSSSARHIHRRPTETMTICMRGIGKESRFSDKQQLLLLDVQYVRNEWLEEWMKTEREEKNH